MIPYSKKQHAIISNMKSKQTIAKPPTSQSSLITPQGLTGRSSADGNIKLNEVAYQITAFNEYGETAACEEFSLYLGTSLDPIVNLYDSYTPGILPRGVYYYAVTAFNDSGETNVVAPYVVKLAGSPHPVWADTPSTIAPSGGLIPAGIYTYCITSVVNGQETTPSTPIQVTLNNDQSAVTLSFKAVEGVSKYYVYRRSLGSVDSNIGNNPHKRIGEVVSKIYVDENQVLTYVDNGSSIGQELAPRENMTSAGIAITWDKLTDSNVRGYRIYGRKSEVSTELKLLAEVSPNINTYKDAGYKEPENVNPPAENTSGFNVGAGITLSWNKVPNASGYNVYGRVKNVAGVNKKGFLTTIPNPNITNWTDTGAISPDLNSPPPTVDNTDGTKGILGAVVPDGVTLSIDANGLLSVKGGIDSFLGRADLNALADKHTLVYDGKIGNWVNLDLQKLIYDLIVLKKTPDESSLEISGVDEKLTEYKNDLINLLNQVNAFRAEFQNLNTTIQAQAEEIKQLKIKLGKSFKERQPTANKND